MKPSALIFSVAMSVSGLVLAQTATDSGVRESTDPAKIADIERRAQELAARQTTPTVDERGYAPKKKHGKRQQKHKAKQKPAVKQAPPSDTPMATEGKS